MPFSSRYSISANISNPAMLPLSNYLYERFYIIIKCKPYANKNLVYIILIYLDKIIKTFSGSMIIR